MTSELRDAAEVWQVAVDAYYNAAMLAQNFRDTDPLNQVAAAVIQTYGDEREAKGRAEQAAELAKFKALAETLAGALELVRIRDGLMDDEAEALRQYKEARNAS